MGGKPRSVFVFKELYPAIVASLDELTESRDGETVGKAMSHLKAITTVKFFVCLEILDTVLNITKPVAKKLQRVQATIVTATDAVTSCIDAIQFYRENENEFEKSRLKIYKEKQYRCPEI